jgi:NADPH-dependent 2,4-dienoyl-CoA reductase/sulfur reductase-like enzyme
VIGAGPAGIRAAEALVAGGLRPIVIDENLHGGGQIFRRPPESILRNSKTLYGFEAKRADALHRSFAAIRSGIDYRPETTVWSVERLALHTVSGRGISRVPFDRLVIATGAMDRIIPVRGWTIPGVYALGGAQVALKSQACIIGERPIFFGTGPLLYLVAYQYLRAGAKLQAVLDTSSWRDQLRFAPRLLADGVTFAKGLYYVTRPWLRGILQTGITPVEIRADDSGRAGSFVWKDESRRLRETFCDSVAFGFNLVSQTQIADLCGLEFEFNHLQRQWLPRRDAEGRSSVPGIYVAGDGAAIGGADVAEIDGARSARALLADLGLQTATPRSSERGYLRSKEKFRHALDGQVFPFPVRLSANIADDVVVCRCERINAGSLRAAITRSGATEINRLKAFTRLGMGRCQGRLCAAAGAEILAAVRGVPIQQAGRLRGQAPVKPISIAALAENAA